MPLNPPPAGGPQFIAGSKPHGTAGLGDSFANLTTQITNSFGFVTAKPVFRGTQTSGAQTTVTSALVPIHLNNILEDPYSGWDAVNNRWMPPVGLSGWFLAVGNVFTVSPGATKVVGALGTNGPGATFYGSETANPSVAHTCGGPCMAVAFLTGGANFWQLQAYTTGTGIATSVTVGQNSHMEIVWISN
jgi:hypothetical protein